MEPLAYQQVTQHLIETLQARSDVIALVALGSMAGTDHQPDKWSDHDFFVITDSGVQQPYREGIAWLPNPEHIVLHFQETAHGCKAIYNDGHLLEYAIFDTQELNLAQVNAYRVLFDKAAISEQLKGLQVTTSHQIHIQKRFDTLLANLLVGSLREARGEKLSAHVFIKQHALAAFIALSWALLSKQPTKYQDTLDSSRRFEMAFPALGAHLSRMMCLPLRDAALGLLKLCEDMLAPSLQVSRQKAIDTIRRQIIAHADQ